MALCVVNLVDLSFAVGIEFSIESNYLGLCSGRAFQSTLP
jgi:hypothetical protein